MVTAGYRVVTVGDSRLPSGYSGLQQVTASYRVVTVVTAGYSRLPSGYCGVQQDTAGYLVVAVGYSRLQQVTESL